MKSDYGCHDQEYLQDIEKHMKELTLSDGDDDNSQEETTAGETMDISPVPESAGVILTRELLDEDDQADMGHVTLDIVTIVKTCLKDVKKLFLEYVKLRAQYKAHPCCKHPNKNASLAVARRMGKGPYLAHQIWQDGTYLLLHQRLPPSKRETHCGQLTLVDNESILLGVRKYWAAQALGTISPSQLRDHVNNYIVPALGLSGPDARISERTAVNWLHKLGYCCTEARKGMYYDGHERPDVVKARKKFLEDLEKHERLMCTYKGNDMEPIFPQLELGELEHILLTHNECIFHVNETQHRVWLAAQQQALRKKGNGAGKTFPEACLPATDACKIIYLGKGHNNWWDLAKLMPQIGEAVDIFEYLHPGAVGVWIFNCSSAHEGLAPDALNINNMNVGPGGKQTLMRDTVIPATNPPPKPGALNTRGIKQTLVYPSSHPDPTLAGKAKGMKQVLQKRVSVYDELISRVGGEKKVVGKCGQCRKSQVQKDAARRVAAAEAAGQEDGLNEGDLDQAAVEEEDSADKWCCIYRVLSLQDDFVNEKPMLQHYIERRGHVCLFYPKFHCELNAIKMLWGYAKYRFRLASDQKFPTTKKLVPQCLDMADMVTIRRFVRKSWRYADAYRKGL
ncbi:hypothetical protein PLICRDRAFT_50427 [Plicaturopsis crispa FD-325 SS-3]|nr:hypothetical protein PLICRDRAFT_50427 [Plicaturopsis crispa FD-325 SS-3]